MSQALNCKVCREPGVCYRNVELHIGDVSIEIEAPLCERDAEELPVKVLNATRAPMVRAILNTLGLRLEL